MPRARSTSQTFAASMLFFAVSLFVASAAQGSFYPGHIDPGGNGTDIPGFTGDVVFSIDPSCINNDGSGWQPTNANTGTSVGCGNATVYSGLIDLYTVSPTDPPDPGVVTGTFSLETNFWPILGVYSVNGALMGVDTDAMGPETGTGDWSSHVFWLQFVSGFCQVGCTAPGNFPGDPAYISLDDINNFSPPGTVIFGPACETATNCFVPSIPEPGSLSLIAGALGGLGWLTRRRKGKTLG